MKIPLPTDGRHIKVLLRNGAKETMSDTGNVARFLARLVKSLDMRMLGLSIYDVDYELEKLQADTFEDEGGVTGVAVLSTSHVSIHTWPERNGAAVLDVYSCREFPLQPVLVMCQEYFRVGEDDIKVSDLSVSLRW